MKTLIVIIIFTLIFFFSLMIDKYEPYKMNRKDSLDWINRYIDQHKFNPSKNLNDAGYDRKLDTAIQRKVFSLKLECDKYEK